VRLSALPPEAGDQCRPHPAGSSRQCNQEKQIKGVGAGKEGVNASTSPEMWSHIQKVHTKTTRNNKWIQQGLPIQDKYIKFNFISKDLQQTPDSEINKAVPWVMTSVLRSTLNRTNASWAPVAHACNPSSLGG
jgi:hypothetical protein